VTRRMSQSNKTPHITPAVPTPTAIAATTRTRGLVVKSPRRYGGIDLDTCRDPETGTIEPWAAEIIQRFNTYGEISPSQAGIKLFFTYTTDDLPMLRAAMGRAKYGKEFKCGNGNHPRAIEVHLANRYFCVTEQHLPGTPVELRRIPAATLLWVLTAAGPAFAKAGNTKTGGNGQDNSRSAIAFRKAVAMRRNVSDAASYLK
jgi:putative DNA primase/helicase